MNIKRQQGLDAAHAEQLLVAIKPLPAGPIRWEPVVTPAGVVLAERRVQARLQALDRGLGVLGRDNGHGGHQWMLQVVGVPGNLARLCDDSAHDHRLHWHIFERMEGLDERREAIEPPWVGGADVSAVDIFLEVFAPRLHIIGDTYSFQEALL